MNAIVYTGAKNSRQHLLDAETIDAHRKALLTSDDPKRYETLLKDLFASGRGDYTAFEITPGSLPEDHIKSCKALDKLVEDVFGAPEGRQFLAQFNPEGILAYVENHPAHAVRKGETRTPIPEGLFPESFNTQWLDDGQLRKVAHIVDTVNERLSGLPAPDVANDAKGGPVSGLGKVQQR